MRNAIVSLLGAALLAGCITSTPPTAVHQPMTARPSSNEAMPHNGAIYQASFARPIFEDRRARYIGDVITINIVEKTQASKQANSSAERSQDMAVGIPTILKAPGKFVQGMNIDANSDSKFSGKGGAAANNAFTGTITCTVIEVLPNGYLLVSGEKVVAINQGEEFIRFSGVVNPAYITASNVVSSTQVADARIEYKANGFIDSSQTMGWLARFFMNFMPF